MNKRAFTLVEVLVASLLLSMLVMILTMVFNQSSIAWRTGKASVAELDQVRRVLAQTQRQAESLLPGVEAGATTIAKVQSAWNHQTWDGDRNNLRQRAVTHVSDTRLSASSINPANNIRGWQKPSLNLTIKADGGLNAYTVGVWSYGPDGEPDTEDDISTWPEDME